MTHHIFTLSVGALTCALIALSVANATDQPPPDSTLNQPIAAETLENAQETQSGEDGPADL